MKIIHTSDLHLNSKIEKLSSAKASVRREELIKSFERLVNYAQNNNVKAIIIAGDMFDTTKISTKVFDRIIHLIRSNDNIDFLYLTGNHEQDSFLSMIDNKPLNLKIFTDDWTYYQYDNVTITGLSLCSDNAKFIYDTLNLNKDNFNIVTLHGQVAGYKNKESAEIISIPLLKDKGIDYLALGHYHSFAEGNIDNRGKFVYSGCLEGRGFDETGIKGFVLIDTDKKNYEFIKFSDRILYEISFDLSNEESWYSFKEKIINELKGTIDSKSLVKVIIVGEHEFSFEKDLFSLDNTLNDYFFYAKIVDQSTLKIDPIEFEKDKSFRGEFVREVLSSDLSEVEKRAVIMKGLNALKGEI